jgi:xanthine/uracil permease
MISIFIFKTSNYWIFNIFILVSFLFYFYWYYSIIKKKLYKKIIFIFSIIFGVFTVLNFFILNWDGYHFPSFVFGALITIIGSFLFFSELLKSNQILYIKNKLSFWIAIGLLLFNVGMVPYMVFSEDFESYNFYRLGILIGLNFILYTCYSLGFIWMEREKN